MAFICYVFLVQCLLNAVIFHKTCGAQSNCPCDLTVDLCDANCCCDTDCAVDDQVFTFECTEDSKERTFDDRLCISENVVFRYSNTTLFNRTQEESGSFLCIYFDNYASRNYYTDVEPINTAMQLNETIHTYEAFSYHRPRFLPHNYTDFYKSGEPLYVVHETGVLGLFRVPKGINSQECTRMAQATYLENTESKCTIEVENLEEACENTSYLATSFYTNGFKFLMTPQVIAGFNFNLTLGNIDVDDIQELRGIYDDKNLIGVECGVDIQSGSVCPLPNITYNDSTHVCFNAVQKVAYVIEHEGTKGIKDVTAFVTVGDITAKDLPLTQSFSVNFIHKTAETKMKLSGNPGYVVGQPVILGIEDTKNIKIYQERDWIVVIRPSANQLCEGNASALHVVNFGEDISTGCQIAVTDEDIATNCVAVRQTLANLFQLNEFSQNAYIAMYGNASSNINDWVKIIVKNEIDTSNNCKTMTVGVHYEFLYAKTGALANPQPKIVAATVEYYTQTVQFKCKSAFCPQSQTRPQLISITQTVSFIDVSNPATEVSGEPPIFYAKLPRDFFYPFLYSQTTHLLPNILSIILVLVFTKVIL